MLIVIAILLALLLLATEIGQALMVLALQFVGGLLLGAVTLGGLFWLIALSHSL